MKKKERVITKYKAVSGYESRFMDDTCVNMQYLGITTPIISHKWRIQNHNSSSKHNRPENQNLALSYQFSWVYLTPDYKSIKSNWKILCYFKRCLGDIDAKYDVIDPTELPLNKLLNSTISGLHGTSRINPSRQEDPEQILERDREKIVNSARR